MMPNIVIPIPIASRGGSLVHNAEGALTAGLILTILLVVGFAIQLYKIIQHNKLSWADKIPWWHALNPFATWFFLPYGSLLYLLTSGVSIGLLFVFSCRLIAHLVLA